MFLGLSNQNLGGLGTTYVQDANGTLRPAGNTGQDWNYIDRLMIPREQTYSYLSRRRHMHSLGDAGLPGGPEFFMPPGPGPNPADYKNAAQYTSAVNKYKGEIRRAVAKWRQAQRAASRRGVHGLGSDSQPAWADVIDKVLMNIPLPKPVGNWEPYKDDHGDIRWTNKFTHADISDDTLSSMTRRSKNMSGLGEDKSGKIADVLESISRGLRKDDGWSGGAFGRPIPLQNVLLYGVLAFGAYKLIELVVKR